MISKVNPFKILIWFIILVIVRCNQRCDKADGMINILKWYHIQNEPYFAIGTGQEAFLKKNCTYTNCFMTNDTSYCKDITDFDAIVFNAADLNGWNFPSWYGDSLPDKRSLSQKYIMHSYDSPLYSAVNFEHDNYMNWTWTYKLDSDIHWPFVIVKNANNEVIGPRKEMHWIKQEDMKPTTEYVKQKLSNKKFAAAWFVSHCMAGSGRLHYAEKLAKELKKYDHELHIYGPCGNRSCPKYSKECYALVESDYYFYLAFENSFFEDYVSEKILTALQHYAVPVVFGGANYSRFVPEGSNLDACALGPKRLAKLMVEAINNKDIYYDFFKWHSHYSFHDGNELSETAGVCELCAALNNATRRNQTTIYTHLYHWWNVNNDIVRGYQTCKGIPNDFPEDGTTTERNKSITTTLAFRTTTQKLSMKNIPRKRLKSARNLNSMLSLLLEFKDSASTSLYE